MNTKYVLRFTAAVLAITGSITAAPIDISNQIKDYVPVERIVEITQNWQATGMPQLFAQPGRPDAVCPTLTDWNGFVAKIEKNGADYTLFTTGSMQRSTNTITDEQQAIIELIKAQNLQEIISQLTENQTIYRQDAFIDAVLALAWSTNYHVKLVALATLAELTKQAPLPDYVYRVWSEAATESNYHYFSEPFDEPETCRARIRQLGIYQTAPGVRTGFVHATIPAASNMGTSNPLVRRTMDEYFFIVSGQGTFYLNDGNREHIFEATPGTCFANPCGMHIQFRNTGDVPMTMMVLTLPPFDDVIRVFPADLEKEIHWVPAYWHFIQYDRVVAAIQEEASKLLRTPDKQQQVTATLANPFGKYLLRDYLIKYSAQDQFIEQKMLIAQNESEDWGLRITAIQALTGRHDERVTELMQKLTHDKLAFVRDAAQIALDAQ